MNKLFKVLPVVLLIVVLIMPSATQTVNASPALQETCSHTGDWVKVDGLSGTSYTYTAPAGYLITEWCYKASTTVNSGVVNPPSASVTVTSTVTNTNGQTQDLSHASFKLIAIESGECEETDTVYGLWSDWAVDPNDNSQEFRTRSVTYVDANDHTVVCRTETDTAYRPRQTCGNTVAVYGLWSDWVLDPISSKEFRTRSVTYVDAVDLETVCDTGVQTGWKNDALVPYCILETGRTIWLPSEEMPEGAVEDECPVFERRGVLTCPDCGPREDEVGEPEDLIIDWYARGECIVNLRKWCITIEGQYVYLRTEEKPYSILVSQSAEWLEENGYEYRTKTVLDTVLVFIDSEPFNGYGGVTYQILDLPREVTGGNFVLYDENGNRWREVRDGRVLKWVSCSRTVGAWDIPENGVAIKDLYGGPVDWDWEEYLKKDHGLSKSDAHKWVLKFYELGELALPE